MNKTDVMEKIYLEYREKVLRYVRKRVNNPTDAEDITSEIFIKIQASLDSYNEEKASLSTWIYTITHNTVCNYYRNLRNAALPLDESLEIASDEEAEIENEILKEQLAIAMEALSECEQDIVVLYYYHDMPLQDISIKIGITYANAKFIKHQALRKLRSAMQEAPQI